MGERARRATQLAVPTARDIGLKQIARMDQRNGALHGLRVLLVGSFFLQRVAFAMRLRVIAQFNRVNRATNGPPLLIGVIKHKRLIAPSGLRKRPRRRRVA